MSSTSWPIYAASVEFTSQYKQAVQFDTATQILLTNETHEDEDDSFTKVSTLPTGLLVVRIYGCSGLSHADFKIDDDILVYARAISGSLGKSTHHTPFAKGKPVWNEYLFFPVQLTGNPKSKSNRLAILIIWRDEAQDKKTGVSSHFLLGQAEFLLNKIAKHRKLFETVDITNKKQQHVGKLQVELALLYGPFGFGQSAQIENHIFKAEEMVKVSMYPKVLPSYEGAQCRGVAAIPRRVNPPSLIPFNAKAEDFEPMISETYGSKVLLKTQKSFPTLANRLTRLPSLHYGLIQQKTRTSRLSYLRGIMRCLDKFDPGSSVCDKPSRLANVNGPSNSVSDPHQNSKSEKL